MTSTQLEHTRDAIEQIIRLMLFRREHAAKSHSFHWMLIISIYMVVIASAVAVLSYVKLQIERNDRRR